MRDILPFLENAFVDRQEIGWARVLSTWGSAPRRPGAALAAVSPGRFAGSVSGGCVENAVIDEILGSLVTGRAQVIEYGVRDETARSVGLSCGGTIRLLVEPFPVDYDDQGAVGVGASLVDSVRADRTVILASRLDGPATPVLFDSNGLLLDGDEPPDGVAEAALPALGHRAPREVVVGSTRWFVHPFAARERLLIVGGADIAEKLVRIGRLLDFETIVVNPHAVFGPEDPFGNPPDWLVQGDAADALRALTPDSDTYAVLLTHDPDVDDPALHVLLRSSAAYIGALGGRKTQETRRARLLEAGFDQNAVDRIDGPVGVPIGAVTPAEIAISIAARLVETRRSRTG